MTRAQEMNIDEIAPGSRIAHFSQRLTSTNHIFTSVLFAVFVTVLLIAIIVGTNVYRALYVGGQETASDRLATALLANIVRSNDAAGALATGEGPEGPALLMREFTEIGIYETRIYQYEGNIVQEYAQSDAAIDPTRANVLEESDAFSFEFDNGLLTIETDGGEVNVALRAQSRGDA